MNRVISLTEHILQEERSIKGATGQLTLLLEHIAEAGKIIGSHVKRSGLVDILGKTGDQNVFNEDVQKLDEYSNKLLVDMLGGSGLVAAIASEELEKPVVFNSPNAKYIVYFDPLDGSSNIDVNGSIGTIFSIYQKKDNTIQMGMQQVASGYILYGSSVMFVYTCLNTVNGFTLDPAVGSFILSNPNMKIPEDYPEYSINEGNIFLYDLPIQKYLGLVKTGEKPYKLRYTGAFVADIHRILIRGGIFLYPHDLKNPAGKLRLMHEVNPMGLLVYRAGGMVISSKLNQITKESINLLTVSAQDIHERTPVVMGSKHEVEKFINIAQNK